ncbi:uncharacterized protein LOC62_01G001546 [Vanrija pseudolonga]|uniref:Ricin B lectin domain-containing protein n=1 Tax=Vanrija pseudolonga TaxID=143232 RepID=A0AAF0Y4M2_9TREE|nr:hypothetical protein LOC62_01G001546 [Vanrija pseudolonga]
MNLLSLALLATTAVLAAPAPAPAPAAAQTDSTAVQTGTFYLSWRNDANGGPIGTGAQFGPGMYNYTKITDGTGIYPGISAPKFFYETHANTSGTATEVTLYDYGLPRPAVGWNVHCVDAGSRGLGPGNGARLSLQPCTGAAGQKWLIKYPGTLADNGAATGKVQLANTNLCWDVTDGDRTKGMQVWTCYPDNPNQKIGIFYTAFKW